MWAYYLLTIGLIFLSFALWSIFSRVRLALFGERAEGTIVDFDERVHFVGDVKKIYYYPVIEFETRDGERQVFKWGGGSSRRTREIGDNLTVMYNSEKPSDAAVNSFYGMWSGVLAMSALAGGSLYASYRLFTD